MPNSGKVQPIADRFWRRVIVGAADECWPWTGARTRGYGKLTRGRAGEGWIYAHRLSWQLHNGTIPKALHVCHTCDNRICVNPQHLFLGTDSDNMRDASAKGRLRGRNTPRGETHARAKLTNEDIVLIRGLRSIGASYRSLSIRFGVDRHHIRRIVLRLSWKHI